MTDGTEPFAPAGESFFYRNRDGLKLHIRDYSRGVSDRLPLICLPGLSRNHRDFDAVARHVSSHARHPRRVLSFDLRGRGLSQWDKDWQNYSVLNEAEDVIAGLDAAGVSHGIFLGTSRGGLITMLLTALRPGAIRGAILNDVGPVIEGDGLTQIRLYLSRQPKPKSWEEAAAIQKSVMEKTFRDMSDDDWRREARARYREFDGKILPDHDPDLVKTMTSLDLNARLPTMWPQFAGLANVEVMVIRGENSSLLSEKTVEEMERRHSGLQVVRAANQGHAPLLHKEGLPETIAAFAAAADH